MAELSSPAAVFEIETAVPWVRKWSPAWVRGPIWLDTRYGTGVADSVGGVGSNDRDRSPISAQIECAAMGGRALPHVVVARVSADF